MRASLTVARLACVSAVLLAPAAADAGVADEAPVIVTVVTLGTLLGIANTVTTLVYSLEDRSFDVPWIVTSFASSWVCGAMTIGFMVDLGSNLATNGEFGLGYVIGALFYGTLTGVPLYWTIKSALAEAEPGETFDAPLLKASPVESALDPISSLSPRATRPMTSVVELGWSF